MSHFKIQPNIFLKKKNQWLDLFDDQMTHEIFGELNCDFHGIYNPHLIFGSDFFVLKLSVTLL